MADGCFLDTNVLLYAISTSAGERLKRGRARLLLQEDDWTVSVQVLQEFFVQATRPTGRECLRAGEARQLIESWQRFTVQAITLEVMDLALDLHQRFPLSYWDAAIIGAAQITGCNLLLSEGMGDGATYGTVLVRNPFARL